MGMVAGACRSWLLPALGAGLRFVLRIRPWLRSWIWLVPLRAWRLPVSVVGRLRIWFWIREHLRIPRRIRRPRRRSAGYGSESRSISRRTHDDREFAGGSFARELERLGEIPESWDGRGSC